MTSSLLTLTLLLCPLLSAAASSSPKHNLVRKSCVHASYPDICFRTLSSYGGAATTPRDLAQAAVRVSLAHVRRASDFLSDLKSSSGGREQGPLSDCVEQMGDSVEDLSKTLAALQELRRGGAEFRWQMSNAETWASAALTNEDTCLSPGFVDEEVEQHEQTTFQSSVVFLSRVLTLCGQ